MTRVLPLVAVCAVLVAAAACDDDKTPTNPSQETAVLTAQLSPANEVPPILNSEAAGSGSVTITMHLTRDAAGAVTNATADFTVVLTGFPAATAVTMAHIHQGVVGVNGPIIVNTGLVPGEVTLISGAATFSKSGVSVPATQAQNILSTPSAYYFNVHTVLNATGAVRGQLVRQ